MKYRLERAGEVFEVDVDITAQGYVLRGPDGQPRLIQLHTRADGSQRAVGFYKIDASNGTATAAPTTYTAVSYCDMKGAKGRSKSAAHGEHPSGGRCFSVNYSASQPATTTTAQKLPLFTNVSYTSAMFRSSGTWISCVYGCCEVGYAQ